MIIGCRARGNWLSTCMGGDRNNTPRREAGGEGRRGEGAHLDMADSKTE